jgi:hypothetical protein
MEEAMSRGKRRQRLSPKHAKLKAKILYITLLLKYLEWKK